MSDNSDRINQLERSLKECLSWNETWRRQAQLAESNAIKLELRISQLIQDVELIIELDHVNDRRKAWVAAKEKP